ncbi:flagellar type III secretion system pore protein FliP [Acidisoma sp. C75]
MSGGWWRLMVPRAVMRLVIGLAVVCMADLVAPSIAFAQEASTVPLLSAMPGAAGNVYSLNVQTLLLITALAFLPGILLLMTAFTRIIIVLSIFRQALGLQSTPPNMILSAIALALTFFIMRGVIAQEQTQAIEPYLAGKINFQDAVAAAQPPIRAFMLRQTRKEPLHLFVDLSGEKFAAPKDVPLSILVPAYATSELETAFQIGFLVYIPFVLIDLAVASILMSLGMIMVSPTLISLPIKLLMFVSINGWALLLGSVTHSFIGAGG